MTNNQSPALPSTKSIESKPKFDPDFSPQASINREAAKAHGLGYDAVKSAYVDDEGALVRDRFGQPY